MLTHLDARDEHIYAFIPMRSYNYFSISLYLFIRLYRLALAVIVERTLYRANCAGAQNSELRRRCCWTRVKLNFTALHFI